jgi:hypothetical protein
MRVGSPKETAMIKRWFDRRPSPRGTLVYEYPAVRQTATQTGRWIDGVVLVDEPERILGKGDSTPPVEGKRVILAQAKASRLGMSLMGQALFSIELMRRLGAEVVESIALCSKGDSALEPLANEAGLRVVVQEEAPEVTPSET